MRNALALLGMIALLGCRQEMAEQSRYDAYEEAPGFLDGKVAQTPVPGTVARGDLELLRALEEKPPLTAQLLDRGQERYEIYCKPCHGRAGYGDGIIVSRGYPAPPSYHLRRLVTAADRHIVDVITDGFGIMYSYADRVPPADRWAIAAYIRALQLSQRTPVDMLSKEDLQHLEEGSG